MRNHVMYVSFANIQLVSIVDVDQIFAPGLNIRRDREGASRKA